MLGYTILYTSIRSGPDQSSHLVPSRHAGGDSEEHGTGFNIVNIGLTPVGPGPWDLKARAKLSTAQRNDLCSQASVELRSKVHSVLLPRLSAFKPDLLLISAGFDAHYDDMYHFLREDDFQWLTEKLIAASGSLSEKKELRVVSVLEGGYSLSSVVAKQPSESRAKVQQQKRTNFYLQRSHVTYPPQSAYAKEYQGGKKREAADGPEHKFAQLPGDGGLVKGVLGHVAGLAGKPFWG